MAKLLAFTTTMLILEFAARLSCYLWLNSRHYHSVYRGPMKSLKGSPEGTSKPDKYLEVEEVITRVNEILETFSSNIDLSQPETDDNIDILNNQFDKLLRDIRTSSVTDAEKAIYTTEATLTKSNYDYWKKDKVSLLPVLEPSLPISTQFSESASPYVCCYGEGKVGQFLKESFKSMGKSVSVKYLDCNTLLGIPENELKFILRGARTILLACDNSPSPVKNGWFNPEPTFSCLDSNSIKRLLNVAMVERNKNPENYPIKVVLLVKGMKESKGVASLLVGDTFNLESEVVLLCSQRNFDYAVVRVGELQDDLSPNSGSTAPAIKEGNTYSRLRSSLPTVSSPSSDILNTTQVLNAILSRPIQLSLSRVDITDSTKVSVAVDAMLRIANYPLQNTSFALLSTPSKLTPTTQDWDDELGKLIGPELHRVPLLYASTTQAVMKLTRTLAKLQESGSGLVTPIAIEKYSNGVRVIFTPKDSMYRSAIEERKEEIAEEVTATSSSYSKKYEGYLSPEAEEKLLKSQTDLKMEELKKKQKIGKLNGGLEFLVDEVPYRRVRIRRCNMGPKTVVKEESEALLIKSALNCIRVLDNDYRLLTSKSFAAAT